MEKAEVHIVACATNSHVSGIGLASELRKSSISHIVQAQQRVGKELDGVTVVKFGTESRGVVKIAVEASETELVAPIFQAYTIERNAVVGVVGEIHARGRSHRQYACS